MIQNTIAVVTSTIYPAVSNEEGKNTSYFTANERLHQTLEGIEKLSKLGFSQIYLIDNSPELDDRKLKALFKLNPMIKIFHIMQYQFNNKGITELIMLLGIIKHLPSNHLIFKISGRYSPDESFTIPINIDFDLLVKGYQYSKRNGTLSTRGYWVKNKVIFEDYLHKCLQEVFNYPQKVVGPRSFLKLIKKSFTNNIANDPAISIEFAAAQVLKASDYHVKLQQRLGIEGYIAGSNHFEKIIE